MQSALDLQSHGADHTRAIGAVLGALVQPGDIILLYGTLGAGKTAFTQGIGQGLGIPGVINSPTFTLLKEYQGQLALYHFDLYRIETPDELLGLGFEDYFTDDGVCVVEWAERGEIDGKGIAWPEDYLRIEFDVDSIEGRVLHISAKGERGNELLAALINIVQSQEGE